MAATTDPPLKFPLRCTAPDSVTRVQIQSTKKRFNGKSSINITYIC